VAHEPCGLHAYTQYALKLACADAFLGRAHEMNGLKAKTQRHMAVLENRFDLDRELLAALVALPQSGTRGLAGQLADTDLIAVAAVRAHRPVRPQSASTCS
jgi:hypothetical protein